MTTHIFLTFKTKQMKTIKIGDFLTLNRDVIIAYEHSSKSEKINKGETLQVISISPNNSECLRLKKEGVSNNIGLTTNYFNL